MRLPFPRLLPLAALCLLPVPLLWAAPAEEKPAGPAVAAGQPAAENYLHATRHLRRGQWFERAAGQLRNAIRQEPGDYRYHLALGCALASRATSLTYAGVFTHAVQAYRDNFPRVLAEWEAAQKDPESDGYGEPRPVPLPARHAFRTKDDNRPFTLTRAQLVERVAVLHKEAAAAWDQAAKLVETPEQRAEVAYTRGWGLNLFQRYDPQRFEKMDLDSGAGGAPAPPKATREAVALATELAPDVSVYWQSLGDLSADRAEASKAYRRALLLNKTNAALWYRLYLWNTERPRRPSEEDDEEQEAPPIPTLTPDPKQGIEDLRQAAQADPLNGFPLYLIAAWKFEETRYGDVYGSAQGRAAGLRSATAAASAESRAAAREAVGFIERGNRAAAYRPYHYRPAVPPLLAAAWNYDRIGWIAETTGADFSQFARLRQLARSATGYGLIAAREGNRREGERANRAVIALGIKITGNWPLKDNWDKDERLIDSLVGIAIASIGYKNLEAVYEQLGDAPSREHARAEYAAFQKRTKAYRQAVQENVAALMGGVASFIESY